MTHAIRAALAVAGFACAVPLALAQGSAAEEIEKYRQALQDGNCHRLSVSPTAAAERHTQGTCSLSRARLLDATADPVAASGAASLP